MNYANQKNFELSFKALDILNILNKLTGINETQWDFFSFLPWVD